MGLKLPPGPIKIEEIVYVDSPEVRAKYEGMIQDLCQKHETELSVLKEEHEKALKAIRQGQPELGVQGRSLAASVAEPIEASAPGAIPALSEVDPLHAENVKLRGELSAAHGIVGALMRDNAALNNEFKRWKSQLNTGALMAASALSAGLGALLGWMMG